MRNVGDIWISETHFHIGSRDSHLSGLVDSGRGKGFIYLLEHKGQIISLDKLQRVTGSENPYNLLNSVRNQLAAGSRYYRLVIDRKNGEFSLERVKFS